VVSFFFLQNQWHIIPHVPSPRFHNRHCISHFFVVECILTLFLYFMLICFQTFCSLFVRKLEFLIFGFAFQYQHLLHGVLLLHCVVCYHQHLLFIEHNLTNNNFCSRIVLCKFRFSSATFLYFGLWHFKQLSFFFALLYNLYIFSIEFFVLNLRMFVSNNFCWLLLPLMH
jgi:hypothetical protein